jgi:hypothetical protein
MMMMMMMMMMRRGLAPAGVYSRRAYVRRSFTTPWAGCSPRG